MYIWLIYIRVFNARLLHTNELFVERLHKDSTNAATIGPTTTAVYMSQTLRADEITSPHVGGITDLAVAASQVQSEADVLNTSEL